MHAARMFSTLSLLIALILTAGCAPKISEQDRQRVTEMSRPQYQNTTYTKALNKIGRVLNKGIGMPTFFQVKPVQNKTGAAALPLDVTEIVLTSVNNLSGTLLKVIPYYPDYLPEFSNAGLNPDIPDVTITGAITQYDKDLSKETDEWDFVGYAPTRLEGLRRRDGKTGDDIEGDLEAFFGSSESMSRVAVDLRLMDYKARSFYPGMQVVNTILIFELERENNLGFMIYGSGLTRTGRISMKQGLHQALRNLIDYSILQLLGMYYNLPFWRALDDAANVDGTDLLNQWYTQFSQLPPAYQISQLQNWLMRFNIPNVYADGRLYQAIPEEEFTQFGRVTQAFTLAFLYEYAPRQTLLISRVESGNFPQSPHDLSKLYRMMLNAVPIN